MAPKTGLTVWLPSPNSGALALPMNSAPAARIRATKRSSAGEVVPSVIGEPIEFLSPATLARSLTAIGSPWSGPAGWPASRAASAAAASASSVSRSRSVTRAFTIGFTASIRSSAAVITSTAEVSRAAIRRAISRPERSVRVMARPWLWLRPQTSRMRAGAQ